MSFHSCLICVTFFMLAALVLLSSTKPHGREVKTLVKREEGQNQTSPETGQKDAQPRQEKTQGQGETAVNATTTTAGGNDTGSTNSTHSEKAQYRDLMFNKEKRTKDETGYISRKGIEEVCEAAKPCYSSNLVVPICGSDGKTYVNPGVFQCAQKCVKKEEEGLKINHFGPCPGFVMPSTTSTTPKTTKRTTPKHTTGEDRIRFVGFVNKVFKWVGMHVHDDGGVYLEDEKENDSWWNF